MSKCQNYKSPPEHNQKSGHWTRSFTKLLLLGTNNFILD
jgi:hypothetical protein